MEDNINYGVSNTNDSSNLKLENSVTSLDQVSSARKASLAELGINTIRDVINYFPRDFIDLSKVLILLVYISLKVLHIICSSVVLLLQQFILQINLIYPALKSYLCLVVVRT